MTSQEARKIQSFINVYKPQDEEPRDKELVIKKRNGETENEKGNKKKKIKTDSKKKEKIKVKAKKTDPEKAKFDCPNCDEQLECESKWRHHISNSHGNKGRVKKNGSRVFILVLIKEL